MRHLEKSFPWVRRVLRRCQGAADPSVLSPVEPPSLPSLPQRLSPFALSKAVGVTQSLHVRVPCSAWAPARGKGHRAGGSPCTATAPPAAPTAPAGVSPPWEAEWVRAVPSVWGYWAVRVWGPPRAPQEGGAGRCWGGWAAERGDPVSPGLATHPSGLGMRSLWVPAVTLPGGGAVRSLHS